MNQLSLRVDIVDCFVWQTDQLQLQKNEILVGIDHYAIEMIF
jgi:hypothetical protein